MRRAVLDLMFPPRCPFCSRVGVRGACEACFPALPWIKKPLREGAGFDRCAVPLRYEGVVREALIRLKFGGARSVAGGCGVLLAQCAAEELLGEFDLVAWVPVSKARRRVRGFDQSELLARSAAAVWGTKPVRLLEKPRDNPPQSGLSAEERLGNVRGIYRVPDGASLQGVRVLLVDDIVTTGSTLAECARTLRGAGAESVVCACVAAASEVTERVPFSTNKTCCKVPLEQL